MSKQERWESVVIILGILTLWPVLHWRGQNQTVPTLYWFVLLLVAVVLGVIMVRRVKRLREAMRSAKRRHRF